MICGGSNQLLDWCSFIRKMPVNYGKRNASEHDTPPKHIYNTHDCRLVPIMPA